MMSQTSIMAFESVREEPAYLQQHKLIVRILKMEGKPLSNSEIQRISGLPINVVTARVNKLAQDGVLQCGGISCRGVGGRAVKVWGVV